MPPEFRRSPLALAILGILAAGPLHPYGIQRRIRQWGKDDVINVGQRSSLYKTIARLEEAGLITASGTDRDPSYPERTTYAITESGQAAARRWMGEMLSVPRNEFPEFPAALSFVPMLSPDELARSLTDRRDALTARMAEMAEAAAADLDGRPLPKVVLLDAGYQLAVLTAELTWVEAVLAEVAAGSLTWSTDDLIDLAGDPPA